MVFQQSSVEVDIWVQELKALHDRIAPRFARAEPRKRVFAYLQGLLSPIERKNGWQLAEGAGESTPDGMQRLLSTAHWDAGAVSDDLVAYVGEHLADPDAVLVIDEIGFLKKGTKSAGVKRQYIGTADHMENCQIGIFLGYSTPGSYVLIDRELYLPEEWLDDRSRSREAAIPDEIAFATKPELAQRMLERLGTARLPFRWIIGGAGYGGSQGLRRWLESRQQAYILALTSNHEIDLPWEGAIHHLPVKEIVPDIVRHWKQPGTADGTKGSRWCDWALVPLASPEYAGWERWLLIRHLEDEQRTACYLVFAPTSTHLETIVTVAGRFWTVGERLQLARREVGLDHYEVRHWVGWYRHITLAMLAVASLAVVRSRLAADDEERGDKHSCTNRNI